MNTHSQCGRRSVVEYVALAATAAAAVVLRARHDQPEVEASPDASGHVSKKLGQPVSLSYF
jgi:hypothetical protein